MRQMVFPSAVIVSAVLHFAGLPVNLFIAVVSYKAWVKSHSLSSSDRILLSVGITRFLLLGLFLLYVIDFLISLDIERSVYLSTFFLLCWVFLESSSLWFVTLLNVLYCVKITNLQHPVCLLLKRSLSAKTPRLLLACVLISALTTLLYVVLGHALALPEFVSGRNSTELNISAGLLSLVISISLSSFLQFIINVTSAFLLINSLRRHIQKMQRNASGFWRPQTGAHVAAMKLMAYFLLLYVPYSVATMFYYLPSVRMGLGTRSTCMIFSTLYPSGHSVLIVLTHPKLKGKAKQILCFNRKRNVSCK